jgi:hypothetical protein
MAFTAKRHANSLQLHTSIELYHTIMSVRSHSFVFFCCSSLLAIVSFSSSEDDELEDPEEDDPEEDDPEAGES